MDNDPIQYTDVTGQYKDNGDGTYSLENKNETVRGLHQKLVDEGKTTLTYDEFAKLNNIDRKTGFINGKGITLNTKFRVKNPSSQKDEQTAVHSNIIPKNPKYATYEEQQADPSKSAQNKVKFALVIAASGTQC